MPIAELFGQQEAIRKLDGELLSGTLSHAYLMWGPAGGDRMKLAMALALAANCSAREPRPGLWYCGECANCTKLLAGVHPDYTVVRPDGSVLKIGQILEMQSRIALRPGESHLKTWVLDDAHAMNVEAQNCLLKTLEEPPGHALIILLADDPGMLLPTISSRCHSVRLGSVERDALAEWGRRELGVSPERAAVLAAVSSGLRGRMERLAAEPAYFKVRNAIISKARDVMWSGDGGKALAVSESLLAALKRSSSGDADASETASISTPQGACDVLAGYMRDVLAASLGGGRDALINVDMADEIFVDAERGRAEEFKRWAEKCMGTGEAIAANANTRLALDDLMLDLALPLT